ncbi:extracellular solute-binding protein [Paenibacillus kribbensis]|uniref:ABC transporter substrate-binding protein n=1 Tax=Paenibacillus kribbensis TaxID=172713 RepID=UPI002DB6723D|nr:extracellular solute-binding protein [Paenibacillus kribbensis]MEC0235987.1 extracellular solute-binding protein [Paenibacillus kribbensis]
MKRFSKTLSSVSVILAASMLLLTACGSSVSTSQATNGNSDGGQKIKLSMFIWAGANQDVVPKEVVADYVKKHPNVQVDFVESSNSVMYPKMVAGQKADPNNPVVNFGYFNADASAKGLNDDMWEPLNPSIVTHMQDIPEQYHTKDNRGIVWGVTNFALVYNKDLVKTPPTSWNDLWENPQFKDKVALWDYMFYSYIAPVIELKGKELGATYDKPEAAFDFWGKHTDQVRTLVNSNDQLKNLLISGEALVAPFSSQTAQTWINDEGAPLAVAIPKEGFVSFPYSLQVVKGSTPEQTRVANEIINELLKPENLTKYAEATGTPVTSTAAQVPDKYKNDPSFSVAEQKKGLNPDWSAMARGASEWKDLWDRLVKTKLQ